ncbi:glycosyl hydrolase-related protein [Thermocatellispora tengchongensis]|uniref:glycosyl hydrolase-related protein n=1 Tax=Thermocatellispora tengchongensis TaxID=1073253 RepID=UPI00362EDB6E
MYEAHGTRARAHLHVSAAIRSAAETDLLERPIADLVHDRAGIPLTLRPFQIRTLRIRRAA